MGYCVLHCEKGKEGAALGNHIDRTEGKEYSFRSADSEKRELNQEFCLPRFRELSMMDAVNDRIAEGYTGQTAIRKDAVRFVETIFSGSADAMVRIQQDPTLFEQWKKETIATAHKLFGEENIVRMSLHMDEKTPHFHCVAVPLVDGRLSAKTLLTRKNLSKFQDDYAQAMKPFGLNRGELGSDAVHNGLTEHLANVSREQKEQSANLANEMARIQQEHEKLSNDFKILEQKKEELKSKEIDLKAQFENLDKIIHEKVKKGLDGQKKAIQHDQQTILQVLNIPKDLKETENYGLVSAKRTDGSKVSMWVAYEPKLGGLVYKSDDCIDITKIYGKQTTPEEQEKLKKGEYVIFSLKTKDGTFRDYAIQASAAAYDSNGLKVFSVEKARELKLIPSDSENIRQKRISNKL